jgi:hypothetical protein
VPATPRRDEPGAEHHCLLLDVDVRGAELHQHVDDEDDVKRALERAQQRRQRVVPGIDLLLEWPRAVPSFGCPALYFISDHPYKM